MPTVLMFARIGSRHFAHLYISGLLRLRLRLVRGLLDLSFEGRRHDRTVRAAREHVAAPAAGPDTGRRTADGDGGTPRAHVPVLQSFLDLLHPAADSHTVSGPESGYTAGLPRATCHGGPQEDRRMGRIPRPTRWAVSMIRFTSSYEKLPLKPFCIARMSPFSSVVTVILASAMRSSSRLGGTTVDARAATAPYEQASNRFPS